MERKAKMNEKNTYASELFFRSVKMQKNGTCVV